MREETILVVAGVILREHNEIFIARRASNKHLAGYWEFPGGKVEENEEEKDCLKRELLEELGVNAKVRDFFMVNQHQYGEKIILLKSYFCELEEPNNFVLNDHDKVEWVKVKELLQYKLAPADIPIAKALNERNLV